MHLESFYLFCLAFGFYSLRLRRLHFFFQMSGQRDETKKSMGVSWRQIHRMFIRKTLHFNSDVNKPNYNNKLWNEIQHFLTYNLIGLTRSFLIFYWRLMITPQYLTVLNVFIWHIIIIETIINKVGAKHWPDRKYAHSLTEITDARRNLLHFM